MVFLLQFLIHEVNFITIDVPNFFVSSAKKSSKFVNLLDYGEQFFNICVVPDINQIEVLIQTGEKFTHSSL